MTAHVDAHLHVWDLDRCHYGWLSPAAGALHRTFTAGEAHEALRAAGMDAAVLVQAADTICDTDAMLDVAAAHPWVAGVVGWVPLADPDAAARELDRRTAAWPVFKGVRHLVHVDPDREFLARPEVVTSLRTVARHGLVLDVPDAWPRHLPATAAVAEGCPTSPWCSITWASRRSAATPSRPGGPRCATWRAAATSSPSCRASTPRPGATTGRPTTCVPRSTSPWRASGRRA